MNKSRCFIFILFILNLITKSTQENLQNIQQKWPKGRYFDDQIRSQDDQKHQKNKNTIQDDIGNNNDESFNLYHDLENQLQQSSNISFQQIFNIQHILKKTDDQEEIFHELFFKNKTLANYLLQNKLIKQLFKLQSIKARVKNSNDTIDNMSNDQKIEILKKLLIESKLSQILQQIQNSSEVFLTKSKHRNLQQSSYTGKNWLSKIQNQIRVSQLSIPGSHDTAAYYSPKWYNILTSFIWKTQNIPIQQQLNKGVRCLDIRVECQANKNLSLYHGNVYLGQFSKFTDPVEKFLIQNPSQFLIIMFKKQKGDENAQECGNKINNQLKSSIKNISQYCYNCKVDVIPTVGQLRGKMWLIQSGGIQLSNELHISTCCDDRILTDDYSYVTQNYWSGPYNQKKSKIFFVINKPKTMMRINFLSQSILPKFYSSRYNKWFQDSVKRLKLKNIGIILADFVEGSLLQTIIQSNF